MMTLIVKIFGSNNVDQIVIALRLFAGHRIGWRLPLKLCTGSISSSNNGSTALGPTGQGENLPCVEKGRQVIQF